MSLAVPTTAALALTIVGQIEGTISQTIPLLPKSFTRVLAKVLAGVFVLLYKYGGFIFLQIFVAHASFEETTINGKQVRPLVEWGRLFGVGDPTQGTRAELVIDVTVTEQEGSLDAGALLLRAETGVTYQTLYPVDLDAATVQVTVRAVADQEGGNGVGEIGDLEAGDEVRFINAIPNVATAATVDSTVTTGADAETAEEYRARVITYCQARPQGGAYADYREWGAAVEGILHIYPYTGMPGEVDVYCESTAAIDADGIPTQDLLDDVYDAIQVEVSGLATRRPVSAAINVYPISRTEFTITVNGLDVGDGGDEDTVTTAINEAVDEYLRTREPFIVGLSVAPRKDRITRSGVASVAESIAHAAGASLTSVDLENNLGSIVAYTLSDGEKAKIAE